MDAWNAKDEEPAPEPPEEWTCWACGGSGDHKSGVACPECMGQGWIEPCDACHKPYCTCVTCTDCGGDGTVEVAGDPVNGPDPEVIDCERCDGLGGYPLLERETKQQGDS